MALAKTLRGQFVHSIVHCLFLSLSFFLSFVHSLFHFHREYVDMWKIRRTNAYDCMYRKYKVGFVSVPFSTQ